MSLAQGSLDTKDYEASRRYSTEAAQLRPLEPAPHRLLAEVYDATGRMAEGAEERRRADQLSRPDGDKPN
jgi:hypothetical protein